jgi:hypothetical protein
MNLSITSYEKQLIKPELSKPKKFKQTLSARKFMATVFWDMKGTLMVEFMQQWTIITSEWYCETLKKFEGPIRTKDVEC